MENNKPDLPPHIENTVRSITQLHTEHQESAGWSQRLVDSTVALVGRPRFLFMLTTVMMCWIGGNVLVVALGRRALDPPPFQWLDLGASLTALYMTVFILANQRHDDRLGQSREQLILGLSILSEQKAAVIISLLEDIRRESPNLTSRTDAGPEDMAKPSDPQSVLKAIKESTDDAEGFRPSSSS